MSHVLTLNNVRLSYVNIFGDGRVGDNGKRSWSLTALVPKTHPQVEAIKAAINAAKEKDAAKVGKTGIKSPLLDGDAKESDGYFKYKGEECRGHYMLRCANYNRRPSVVDANVQPVLDPDQIYSGCFANLRLSFYGYATSTNKGISPGLDAVQKVRDGDRLGSGGVNPNEVFTVVEEEFLK